MKNENRKKLKKYLFFISILFCVMTFAHLATGYVYENASSKPVKGGTISEGLVGNFPSLNPLKVQSGNNKYLMSLVYRSLLRYDLKEKKIKGDITNCDISSLVNIECGINQNAVWSDGEPITADDIKSTYNIIKETKSNPVIASLLQDVEIETNKNVIIFRNNKKDINFLNIFFQPILSQSMINTLTEENITGSFPYKGRLYSGEYMITDIQTDQNLGVSKILLERNPHYGDSNISKIFLYIFPDIYSLQRNIQAINVYNDSSNLIGESIYRLGSHKYTTPKFVSLFLNMNKVENKDLRTFILNEIKRDNLIDLLGKDSYKAINNPYFGDKTIEREANNKNFSAIMESLGYKKKSALIEQLKKGATSQNNTQTGTGAGTSTTFSETDTLALKGLETRLKELENADKNSIKALQKDSHLIVDPSYVDKYNFITKDNVTLKGVLYGKNPDAIHINDYQLKGYKKGDKNFYYKLSRETGTIKEGSNSYNIYFENNGEKQLEEQVNFLFYPNKDTLDKETPIYINTLFETKIVDLKAKIDTIKSKEATSSSQTETSKESEVNQIQLQKLEALEEKLYYNSELQPFTLKLIYLSTRQDFDTTATFIQKSLQEIGIVVEIDSLSKEDFSKELTAGNYDLVLGGIDSGFFDFNLYPYFHSSQAENGFNYSNIRKTSLDLLLEEARENIYTVEKTEQLENKVLDILRDEQVIKTLFTPKSNLLIDKNIKLEDTYEILPNEALHSEIIEKSYMKQQKEFSLKGKTPVGFIQYIGNKLYE